MKSMSGKSLKCKTIIFNRRVRLVLLGLPRKRYEHSKSTSMFKYIKIIPFWAQCLDASKGLIFLFCHLTVWARTES